MSEDDAALVARAKAGDAEARTALVARATLKGARAILGTAKDREEWLRQLVRADGATPALGPLLAAIADDEGADVKGTAERVRRTGSDRWGPAERLAIARFAAACGARLGAEEQVELLEWIAQRETDTEAQAFVHAGAAAALADAAPETIERLARRTGFERFVVEGDPLVLRWIGSAATARAVATALFSARAEVVHVLDAILDAALATEAADTWTAALGHAIGQNRGMAGRDAIADWGWARFCARPGERALLYAAFRPWRQEWKERRDEMPGDARPGGASAVEHLRLWGGLDVEYLSEAIEEAVRLAADRDWPALVDLAFDLAEPAPQELRRHALAGACRMAHEVTNRARDAEIADGVAAGAVRLEARGGALAASLRASGAVLDQIVANRAEDLETDLRLIREARDRRVERARRDEEQALREQQRLEAQRQAEAARVEAQAALAGTITAAAGAVYSWSEPRPGDDALPVDLEVRFPSLPCPTLLAYARMFKRMSQGGVQSLVDEGVSYPMLGVVNESWAAMFRQDTALAIRFSTLISSPWV